MYHSFHAIDAVAHTFVIHDNVKAIKQKELRERPLHIERILNNDMTEGLCLC